MDEDLISNIRKLATITWMQLHNKQIYKKNPTIKWTSIFVYICNQNSKAIELQRFCILSFYLNILVIEC